MQFRPRQISARTKAAVAAAALCVLSAGSLLLEAQPGSQFMGSADDVAIAYSTAPLNNIVDDLNRRLEAGSAALKFEGPSGFLQSVLEALTLPADSQLLVFTQLSLQGRLVNPGNPRALFFNDRAALGWVRGAELIEVAAHDQNAGVVFYTLEQRPSARPRFTREFRCLGCHMSGNTLGVPGLMAFSMTPASPDQQEKIITMDHRSPLTERWGGWFVTGQSGAAPHLGNRVPSRSGGPGGAWPSLAGLFNPDGFRSTSSDIAALLTFSHQTHMTNLLTRASWEARAADPALHPKSGSAAGQQQRVEAVMTGVASEVVDYMLFVDEAPLPNPVGGLSGFAARMSASGPRDRRGRSLYELDLETRLLKYPCSYLIYSPAFDALPPLAKAPIYQRMWQVLSGDATEPRYHSLSLADRRAIVEILRETKADLPAYFQRVAR
jgi:hypothetical protein